MLRPSRMVHYADLLATAAGARRLQQAASDAANLILPSSCAVCGRADQRLCPSCAALLREQLYFAPVSARLVGRLEVPTLGRSIPVLAHGFYANELARAVLAYKEHQRYFLRELFAPYLASGLNALASAETARRRLIVAPMPSSLSAVGRRGYRPVEAVLEYAERRAMLNPRLDRASVMHYRVSHLFTGAQKKRSGPQRRAGRSGFLVHRPADVRHQPIILVDDVMTTGSTLQKAVVACNDAGFKVVGAVVLALTKPPNEGSNQ